MPGCLEPGEVDQFIHHEPNDVPGSERRKGSTASTLAAMKALGLVIDEPLWIYADSLGCGSRCDGSAQEEE